MDHYTILVTGGRKFKKRSILYLALDELLLQHKEVEIIHGGATGADTLAGEWAYSRNMPVRIYLADWDSYGRAAGPIRNKEMLEDGKPDLVVAFPGGFGTNNMVEQALNAKVPVQKISC